jgi:hypothetical protein
VDDLHVDAELAALVVEDEDADAATARVEGGLEAGVQVALLGDGQARLDIAGLGHGDDHAVLEVEDAVLLEDGAEHGLDDDAGGGVRDEGGLLAQLLGEQVNTEVAVLAGGARGRDADDLAGTALEHQDVTHADMVAGDGDGVGQVAGAGRAGRRGGSRLLVVRTENLVSHLVESLTEGVVVTGVLGRLLRLLDGFLNRVVVLVLGDGKAGVVGRLGLVRVLFVERGGRGGVVVVAVGDFDGGLGHANFLLVLGLVAGTVLTLDLVDGRVLSLFLGLVVVVMVVGEVVVVVVRFLLGVVVVKGNVGEVMGTTVNLDDSLGVMGVSSRGRSVLLVTWGSDFFLAVRLSLLHGRRGSVVVVVVVFAAGFLRGELDLELRVGLGGGLRLGLSSLFVR